MQYGLVTQMGATSENERSGTMYDLSHLWHSFLRNGCSSALCVACKQLPATPSNFVAPTQLSATLQLCTICACAALHRLIDVGSINVPQVQQVLLETVLGDRMQHNADVDSELTEGVSMNASTLNSGTANGSVNRSASIEDVLKALGFASWKSREQRAAVESVVSSTNVLALLPTGAGKSLIYMIPAIVLGGITVIIAPFRALISDACNRIRQSLQRALQSNDAGVGQLRNRRNRLAFHIDTFIWTSDRDKIEGILEADSSGLDMIVFFTPESNTEMRLNLTICNFPKLVKKIGQKSVRNRSEIGQKSGRNQPKSVANERDIPDSSASRKKT